MNSRDTWKGAPDLITRYDTAKVAPRDRFEFWREAVCNSFVQLGCDTPQQAGFAGKLEIARHSTVSISKVNGTAHIVERRKRDIRAAADDFFLLSLQTKHTSRISQFGNVSVLQPGDMALYDSTHPYSLELSDDFAKTVVQLPRDRLLARLPNAQMMGGTRIDGQSGIGKLVRENILAFSQHVDPDQPTVAALLQDTLIDLIATGLATGIGTTAELSSPEQHILLRARSYIGANLGDPDLDRNAVAAKIGMSVRRLSDIFAKDGVSIAEDIRTKRLAAVAENLRAPQFDGLTISEIAMKFGFSNLQHFSTLFRSVHGMTPKQYRSTGVVPRLGRD